MVVVTDIDLHDVDPAGEFAGAGVLGADRHAVIVADVVRLVGGEDQRLRHVHPPGTDARTIV